MPWQLAAQGLDEAAQAAVAVQQEVVEINRRLATDPDRHEGSPADALITLGRKDF